jgi:hypothetical protein
MIRPPAPKPPAKPFTATIGKTSTAKLGADGNNFE